MSTTTSTDKYVVKIARATYSSIVFLGPKVEAEAKAAELNLQYQTDEYKLEKFDPERFLIL